MIPTALSEIRQPTVVFQNVVDDPSDDRVFTHYDSTACSQLTKKSRKAVSPDVAAVSIE